MIGQYGAYTAPPALPPRRRSLAPWWVAALVFGTGATFSLMWFFFGGLPITNHAAHGRMSVPGGAYFQFPEGQVVISFEEDGIVGENDSADMPSDLTVTVLSPAGGAVPIERLSENLFAINIEGTGRVPYGQMSVPAAGTYQVSATANEPTSAVSPRVTFGEPPLNPFGPAWLGALIIVAPFALVALILMLPLRRG